ncbi:MAG: hypothetical protein CSA65_08785 [Proteobacteria bacterium]|nr:MAG: hypothetical protein CSA65_08785 [Pseudomonadota bacterium]
MRTLNLLLPLALRQRGVRGTLMPLAVALVSALAASACGSTKTYELSWTLDGQAVTSAKDCSSSGIDAIEVTARKDSDSESAIFGCYSPVAGSRGVGPDLASGPWALGVRALSASGARLTAEVVVQALIPDEGTVAVTVDLPRPSSCADGVDNDGDGAVDAFDSTCVDAQGVYDPQLSER